MHNLTGASSARWQATTLKACAVLLAFAVFAGFPGVASAQELLDHDPNSGSFWVNPMGTSSSGWWIEVWSEDSDVRGAERVDGHRWYVEGGSLWEGHVDRGLLYHWGYLVVELWTIGRDGPELADSLVIYFRW